MGNFQNHLKKVQFCVRDGGWERCLWELCPGRLSEGVFTDGPARKPCGPLPLRVSAAQVPSCSHRPSGSAQQLFLLAFSFRRHGMGP